MGCPRHTNQKIGVLLGEETLEMPNLTRELFKNPPKYNWSESKMGHSHRSKTRLLFGRGMAKFFRQISLTENNLEHLWHV